MSSVLMHFMSTKNHLLAMNMYFMSIKGCEHHRLLRSNGNYKKYNKKTGPLGPVVMKRVLMG